MNRILALCLVPLALLLNGCAGYRLGSMLPDDVKTVSVSSFVNKTREPLVEIESTQKTIEELQRDGSLSVAKKESADAQLEVTIVDFQLQPVRYDSERGTTARQYRMWLTANVVLKRTKDNSIIVDNPRVRGEYVFDVLGDLTSSKTRALPFAAEDLAHNIVETIVEVW